nr:lactosylceramide 4-alpha-galactosyltransferase-like [Onthophagus taurus]
MQRVFLIVVSLGFLFIITYTLFLTKPITENKPSEEKKLNSRLILNNFFNLTIQKHSIFFLDTSLKRVIAINPRASCALESAALYHPNRSIYYIYVIRNEYNTATTIEEKYLRTVLKEYKNVNVVYAKVPDLIKNTCIQELFGKHLIETSSYFVEHFSDAFRLIVLMKFGGIYLDSDVIVMRSLNDLGLNFVGKESETVLGTAILAFEKGSYLLNALLKDFNINYDPKSWSGHGPLLLTKLVSALCNTTSNFSHNECDYLKIFPENVLFPVSYHNWRHMFHQKYLNEILEMTKESYLIHFWNKLTHGIILNVKSNAPYLILGKKNCPKTIFNLNKSF